MSAPVRPPISICPPAASILPQAAAPAPAKIRLLDQPAHVRGIISKYFFESDHVTLIMEYHEIYDETNFLRRTIITIGKNLGMAMISCNHRLSGKKAADLNPLLCHLDEGVRQGVKLLDPKVEDVILSRVQNTNSTNPILIQDLSHFLVHASNFGNEKIKTGWLQLSGPIDQISYGTKTTIGKLVQQIETMCNIDQFVDIAAKEVTNLLLLLNKPEQLLQAINQLAVRTYLFTGGGLEIFERVKKDPREVQLFQALMTKQIEIAAGRGAALSPSLLLLDATFKPPQDFTAADYSTCVNQNPLAKVAYYAAGNVSEFLGLYGSHLYAIKTDFGTRYAIAIPTKRHIDLQRNNLPGLTPEGLDFANSIVMGKSRIGDPRIQAGMLLLNRFLNYSVDEAVELINGEIDNKYLAKRKEYEKIFPKIAQEMIKKDIKPVYDMVQSILPTLLAGLKEVNGTTLGFKHTSPFHEPFKRIILGGIAGVAAAVAKDIIVHMRGNDPKEAIHAFSDMISTVARQLTNMKMDFDKFGINPQAKK